MPEAVAVNYEDAIHAKYDNDMGWCGQCKDFKCYMILDHKTVCGKCRHLIIDVEEAKKIGLITF